MEIKMTLKNHLEMQLIGTAYAIMLGDGIDVVDDEDVAFLLDSLANGLKNLSMEGRNPSLSDDPELLRQSWVRFDNALNELIGDIYNRDVDE